MTRTLEHLSTRRQTCSSATLSQILVYGIDMDRNRVTEARRLNYGKDRDRQSICQHITCDIGKSTVTNMATMRNVEFVSRQNGRTVSQ